MLLSLVFLIILMHFLLGCNAILTVLSVFACCQFSQQHRE